MAEDEQFSLSWNNFNSNLSAGFHESLCRGDLVDVTLAADGQLVKAHRLVLSVCSPYFRKMFTQMPANQHAFVFLKDVSHAALKDLIQFMYCGEVNVKQDALPAFISTAEALQIKGLTETGESVPQTQQQTTTVLAATPAKETTTRITTVPVHQTIATTSRPIKVARAGPAAYKLESEDSSDDKVVHAITVQTPTLHTVKRQQKNITPQSAPASKRIKITTTTADPLEAVEPAQITIQDKDDEFINIPIEQLNTKTEPHDTQYTEQSSTAQVTEVEAHEQDNTTYVEDDGTYGEIAKYDDSYFTEGDESGKPGQSSFGESYTATTEQGQEAQEFSFQMQGNHRVGWDLTSRKHPLLLVDGYAFFRSGNYNRTVYWCCVNVKKTRCSIRCKTTMDSNWVHGLTGKFHNHRPYSKRIGARGNPFVGRPSTSISRLPLERPLQNFQSSRMPPLPQLTIRKNQRNERPVVQKKPLQDLPPPLADPLTSELEVDDSLSNQLVNFLNPDIEIKSEPNSDHDADYMD